MQARRQTTLPTAPTIKPVVTAHPSRSRAAQRLVERLDIDPEVIWAEGDIWHTSRRALFAHDGADYVCTIQEDAIPCRDLIATVAEIISAHPGRCINLYLGTVRPHQVEVQRWMLAADDSGSTIIDGRGPLWAVGLVIPTALVPEMVEYGDRYQNAGQSYDSRLTAWSNLTDTQWLYPWPSLVDHDTTVPSLHSSTPDRRAHRFIGDRSPLGTDWSRVQLTDAASLHPPVRFRHETTGRVRRVGKFSREWERMMKRGPWRLVE